VGRIAVTKMTSKFQATIPAAVREKLRLHRGDAVCFEEGKGGAVTIRKALPADMAYTRGVEATLGEWASDADEDAYGGL
jgi:antitoxin PrlF